MATLATSFLIAFSLFLVVSKSTMISQMSSKFVCLFVCVEV